MILFHINITSVQWRTAQILVRFSLSAVYMNNFPCRRAGITMSFWTRFLFKEIVDFRRTHAQTNKSCQGKLIKKTIHTFDHFTFTLAVYQRDLCCCLCLRLSCIVIRTHWHSENNGSIAIRASKHSACSSYGLHDACRRSSKSQS